MFWGAQRVRGTSRLRREREGLKEREWRGGVKLQAVLRREIVFVSFRTHPHLYETTTTAVKLQLNPSSFSVVILL